MGQPAMLACSHKVESMSSQDARSPESIYSPFQKCPKQYGPTLKLGSGLGHEKMPTFYDSD